MEAMASGLPVISTQVMGIPELVRDGESGLLVAARALGAARGRDPPAGARSRSCARAFGEAGRARVAADFDVRASARRLHESVRGVDEKAAASPWRSWRWWGLGAWVRAGRPRSERRAPVAPIRVGPTSLVRPRGPCATVRTRRRPGAAGRRHDASRRAGGAGHRCPGRCRRALSTPCRCRYPRRPRPRRGRAERCALTVSVSRPDGRVGARRTRTLSPQPPACGRFFGPAAIWNQRAEHAPLDPLGRRGLAEPQRPGRRATSPQASRRRSTRLSTAPRSTPFPRTSPACR